MSSNLLNKVKVIAVDLDGVVYAGNSICPGADAAIYNLRKSGSKVVFASNNSGKKRIDIVAKLEAMGISALQEDILTSAYLAGCLIKSLKVFNVLVIGADGLKEEIKQMGVTVVDNPPVDLVAVGLDTTISYETISMAMRAIQRGAVFLACNRDANYPGDNGILLPGCGSIVAAIEAAAKIPPHYIAGKPSTFMLQNISDKFNVRPDEILVVGDNIDIDIKMAIDFKSPAVLIGSNTTESSDIPKYCYTQIQSLSELPHLLKGK